MFKTIKHIKTIIKTQLKNKSTLLKSVFLRLAPERLRHEENAARPPRPLVLEPRVADCNKDNRKRTHHHIFSTFKKKRSKKENQRLASLLRR